MKYVVKILARNDDPPDTFSVVIDENLQETFINPAVRPHLLVLAAEAELRPVPNYPRWKFMVRDAWIVFCRDKELVVYTAICRGSYWFRNRKVKKSKVQHVIDAIANL